MRYFSTLTPIALAGMMATNLALAAGSRAELTSGLRESLRIQGIQATRNIEKSLRPSFDAAQELDLLRARLAGYAWARVANDPTARQSRDPVADALDLTGVATLGQQIDEKINVEVKHAGHVVSALTWTFGLGILRTGLER